MARILVLKNRLPTWLGQIDIVNEDGKLAYQAVSAWRWGANRWRLRRGGSELAVLERPWFTWTAAWHVSGALGNIVLERTPWAMKRRYTVMGGSYDGTVISGSLWDRSFAIEAPGRTLARASNALLSLRDRHQVEILEESAELLCIVAMLVIKADRNSEAAAAAS
ncbi:hypothetical protein LE190_20850 [Massilia oculi]|uniref:DUF4902 domain-containing protein n=1 Tax=Massilia hydrophila TaxID=3044279 RepID=A0ABS7YF73_9BURK|nr:hypothetical protein [Massilia oculi]MCA1858359.1 hypothetical protein [Massilia oculi]